MQTFNVTSALKPFQLHIQKSCFEGDTLVTWLNLKQRLDQCIEFVCHSPRTLIRQVNVALLGVAVVAPET